MNYPEGLIVVWDAQRNIPVPRPPKEPDENQELRIMKDGEFVPFRRYTPIERVERARALISEARHLLDDADDELDDLERELP